MIIVVPFRAVEHEAILTIHRTGHAFNSVQEVAELTGLRESVIKAILKKHRESK